MHLGQASQGNLHFLCSISLRVMYVVLSFQKVHIYFVSEWLTSDLDCVLRLTYDWHQPSATPHLLLLSQPAAVLAAAAELGDCQGCCSDCYWLLLAVKITAVRHPTSGREHQPPGHRPGQRGHGAQVISAVPELHLSVNIEGLFIVGLNSTLKEPTVHCFQSEEKPCNEKN